MDDLIDRQAAIDAIRDHKRNVLGQREWDEGIAFGYSAAHEHICDIIKTLPTIVERKKGKWISKYNGKPVKVINGIPQESCACSVCGKWLIASDEYGVNGNYCPNCGSFNGGEE